MCCCSNAFFYTYSICISLQTTILLLYHHRRRRHTLIEINIVRQREKECERMVIVCRQIVEWQTGSAIVLHFGLAHCVYHNILVFFFVVVVVFLWKASISYHWTFETLDCLLHWTQRANAKISIENWFRHVFYSSCCFDSFFFVHLHESP